MAGASPRLETLGFIPFGIRVAGASPQAGDIRFYTLRYLSPRLVVRDTRGWGESQAGSHIGFSPLGYAWLGRVPGWRH